MRPCYIQSSVCFTAYNTFVLQASVELLPFENTPFLRCLDFEVKDYINPRMARRMSTIVRRGVAAANKLSNNGEIIFDSIVVGTGLGCLQDTEKFIADIVSQKEENVSPTPFIQSTHNTIAGQIALSLKCNAYNMTYSQRGGSFMTGLIDAFMQIEEGKENVFVGGTDEWTEYSFNVLSKLGYWSDSIPNNLCLAERNEKRTLAGEGATYFLLGSQKSNVQLLDVDYKQNIDNESLLLWVDQFLKKNNVAKINALVLGKNGEKQANEYYQIIENKFEIPVVTYKHLCGEFHTSEAVGLWAAQELLKNTAVKPNGLIYSKEFDLSQGAIVLVYNNYFGNNHSISLVQNVI